jgi:UDP-glucose 4-epimerase
VGKRILITGLSTFWGGRLAQTFERDPAVDVVVGMDTAEPVVALERTEFVRCDESYSSLARLVRATQVDTIVHAALIVDSTQTSEGRLHEQNVIGTMNLLAAAGAEESAVTSLVVKSSTLVYGAHPRDPTWFAEDHSRSRPARTGVERSLLEVEDYLRSFSEERPDVRVTVLRFANVLGRDIVTAVSQALSLPLVPTIAGFDSQLQFVEEDDVVRAIRFVMERGLDGVFNVAGDGRLPWSEVRSIAGKAPLRLPPVLTGAAVEPLSRLGVVALPPEVLDLLRYGRGVDNRKLKAAGFSYRYTTAGAVRRFAEAQRLRRVVGDTEPSYRYQSDVEAFFRHSPAVVRPG